MGGGLTPQLVSYLGTALVIKPILFFNEQGKIDAPEGVRTKHKAVQRLDCKEIFIVECSPVIGVHVGPGTIGIALYAEDQ